MCAVVTSSDSLWHERLKFSYRPRGQTINYHKTWCLENIHQCDLSTNTGFYFQPLLPNKKHYDNHCWESVPLFHQQKFGDRLLKVSTLRGRRRHSHNLSFCELNFHFSFYMHSFPPLVNPMTLPKKSLVFFFSFFLSTIDNIRENLGDTLIWREPLAIIIPYKEWLKYSTGWVFNWHQFFY